MKVEGSVYYPISALVCVCATTSSLFTSLCGGLMKDPSAQKFSAMVAIFFGFVLLGTSALALCSLLICGSEDVGRVLLRRRSIPALAVWTGYLVLFLLPWLGVLALLAQI